MMVWEMIIIIILGEHLILIIKILMKLKILILLIIIKDGEQIMQNESW